MKIRTRIAAAVTTALMSVFVAVPAFAHGDEQHDNFSHAGEPLQVVPILIVGVVLLAVVLITSTLVGNLFEKPKR